MGAAGSGVCAAPAAAGPTYTFTGKEWYVRARVVSTKPHRNPYQQGDTDCAWTQPMVP